MDNIFKKVLQFLLQVFSRYVTYRDYAESVLQIADMFFDRVVPFVRELVEGEQVFIDDMKVEGKSDALISQQKSIAGARVDTATRIEFSASPTFVPGFVRRGVRDAWAYIVNHPEGDERNVRGHEEGFFRAHNDEEIKEIVENGLNKGWSNK